VKLFLQRFLQALTAGAMFTIDTVFRVYANTTGSMQEQTWNFMKTGRVGTLFAMCKLGVLNSFHFVSVLIQQGDIHALEIIGHSDGYGLCSRDGASRRNAADD
jgi:hypothetical protein